METWKKKGRKDITIEGSADKRCVTGTFGISLSCVFLPVQLTYGGKMSESILEVAFSDVFSVSKNQNYFSDTEESLKYLHEIIISYMKN